MQIESPFDGEGCWLRCALHTHSTNSDGELAPELLAAHYARAGYDVLCITDHWVRTVVEDVADTLVIPGVELNATIDQTGSDAHVLGLGIGADPIDPGRRFPSLQQTVDWILENDGLPFLAHPYWSGLRVEEFSGCRGLLGLEVFNAGCELEIGRDLSAVQWDYALEAGEWLARSRHGRLALPRLRQRSQLGLGPSCDAIPRSRARRATRRALLQHERSTARSRPRRRRHGRSSMRAR